MTKPIGPHSRAGALGALDRRGREARLLQATIDGLLRHLGGAPSIAQRMLVERAGWLTLHLALMDRQAVQDGRLSERNGREFLAWHNSLVKTLRAIGLKGIAERGPSLAEMLAAAPQPADGTPTGRLPRPMTPAASPTPSGAILEAPGRWSR